MPQEWFRQIGGLN